VTGCTDSTDFPTAEPLQATYGGGSADAFVAKLNAAGSALVYSTYLGGEGGDCGQGIAVDSYGNAYVTGYTDSFDFPTVNPFQATDKGFTTAFVAKLNAAGSALVYSTYLGGSLSDTAFSDVAYGIAVDASGNAYVTGSTNSTDFPTVNPLQSTCVPALPPGYCNTAFVSKLNAEGSALVYSTYLGGSHYDLATGIAVDSSGNAYVTGYTTSTDFPSVNPLQATNNSPDGGEFGTAFVASVDPAGSALTYSTYLGGNISDYGLGIAADSSSNAYVTGYTESTDFPIVNPLQAANHGSISAFMTKISPAVATFSPTSLTFGAQSVGTTSAPQTVIQSITGEGTLLISSITASGDFAQTNDCGSSLAQDSFCTISVTFVPTATGARSGSVTITNNASVTPQTVPLTGTATNPVATLSATSMSFGYQVINKGSAFKKVTLTNTGPTTLTISQIGSSGTNASDFGEANNCPGSMAAGTQCTISVMFTPSVLGAETASLTVIDNATNSPQTVALTGTGVMPVELSPTSLNFGNVDEGVSSAARTITMTNYQKVTLTGISVGFTGSTGYTQTNTCGTSINAGKKCTITVTFKPSIIGTDDATLSITDSASNSPQTAALTGKGTTPVGLTPASTIYASQTVGTTSTAKVFTLTSYLNATLNNIVITPSGDFAVSSSTCTTTLTTKAKCTIDVVFKPTATGTRTGTLKVTDSAANSPQTSKLTGTGK